MWGSARAVHDGSVAWARCSTEAGIPRPRARGKLLPWPRVPPLPRSLVVLASLALGCFGPPGPRSRPPGEAPPASAGPSTEAPTVLLAAHAQPPGAVDREFALPVTGVVYLVFSRPID